MQNSGKEIWLVRHGETEWSLSGAHTGKTDIPLTARGEERAASIRTYLRDKTFALVLTSPMQRAIETCRIAGYGDVAVIEENLREWDYGDYEGRTTADIRKERPDWFLWKDGVPHGETVEQVGIRAQQVIERALSMDGPVALFAHGHILRILTACWLGLAPNCGRLFALSTGSVSVLGYERDTRVINSWNRSSDE